MPSKFRHIQRHGFELPASASTAAESSRAKLEAMGELNVSRRIVVYLGTTLQKHESGIEVWPIDHFLRQLESQFL